MSPKLHLSWISLVVFWFLLQPCHAGDLHLYELVRGEDVGDRDQVRALGLELKKAYKNGTVSIQEIEISKHPQNPFQGEFKKQIEAEVQKSKGDSFLALTVGNSGVSWVKSLSSIEGLKTCHLSHQITQDYLELLGRATVCILPKQSVTPKLLQSFKHSTTRLIQTQGVLHSLTLERSIEEFQKNRNSIPIPASSHLIGVILGGDAPDSKGQIHHFSKTDVESLADYTVKRAMKNSAAVLVLNGPRTGKYNPGTDQVNTSVHRDGVTDPITRSFVEKLQKKLPKTRVTLFDFQFGKPSLYKAVVGAIHETAGELYVPGESISMVTECEETLPGHVFVYENHAMSSTHFNFVKMEYQNGRINLISKEMKEYPLQGGLSPGSKSLPVPLGRQVAEELLKTLFY